MLLMPSFSPSRAMVAGFSPPRAMVASFSRPRAMAASFSPPGIWPRTGALPSSWLILSLLILFVVSGSSSLTDSVNGVEDGHNFYCFQGFIRCMSGIKQCIKPEQQCDGLADCNDGSDEGVNCQHFNCTPLARIKCPSGMMCTNRTDDMFFTFMLCDGVKHCADGSDEDPSYCATYDCISDEGLTLSPSYLEPIARMRCPGGKGGCMLPERKLCDGVVDCVGDGGSDEEDEYCKKRGCELTRLADLFQCRSGRCLWRGRVCDGKRDCPDGDDEGEFCERMDCRAFGVKCRGGNNRTCIAEVRVCDGVEDCPGGTDEAVCDKQACKPPWTNCTSKKYCRWFRMCDGVKECADGSDEDPTFCRTYNCSDDWKIKCKDGVTCISESSICDGRKDCPDKSDEDPVYCRERHNCTGYYGARCPGSQYVWCTRKESLCDGKVGDCYGDAEEKSEFCNSTETALLLAEDGRINCMSNVTYFLRGEFCDGREDCEDGSDERPEFCRRHHCREGKVKCYGKWCVPGRRCDGERDCPDGSDEEGCSAT